MPNISTFDREEVFQLVSNQAWKEILDLFKDNAKYEFICSDSIIKDFIDKYFIDELLNGSSIKNDPAYKYYLQKFFILNDSSQYNFKLDNENFEKLIVKIIEIETNIEQAYNYAQRFPENSICKAKILEYENKKPSTLSHSQSHKAIISENNNLSSIDARISLFKSKQEFKFYRAVKEVYQNYLVLPNVALSAVIYFGLIKDSLSQEERNYFFKSLIDCVVIDTDNNYKPIKFVELDSPYHDLETQRKKDLLKDNILSISGQKLIRIRQITFQEDETDFIRLIREVIFKTV